MTAESANARTGSDHGCPGLRVLARRLEAAGFETDLADLDCRGEPTALEVTNPLTRAYAEVRAEDGGLELRCWSSPRDDEVSSIAARVIRVLTTGSGDDPSAAAVGPAARGETGQVS